MLPLANGIVLSDIPANQQIPQVDSWNFTVEREVGHDVTASPGYVGNVGRDLNMGWNTNEPIPGPGIATARQPYYALFRTKMDYGPASYHRTHVFTGNPFAGTPHDRNQWFNPAAFAVPALYMFGDAPRNALTGPPLFSADWALFKNFKIAERFHLQFRWEVYNALTIPTWRTRAAPTPTRLRRALLPTSKPR